MAGGEVDRELITFSDQGSYTDPGVVLATLFQRIDNLDRVDLVILLVGHRSSSIFDVHQHFKATAIDDVHPHHLGSLYFTHWVKLLLFSCGIFLFWIRDLSACTVKYVEIVVTAKAGAKNNF